MNASYPVHVGAGTSRQVAAFARTTAHLLPILQDTNGAVYGSWAMMLHTRLAVRAPHDLDIEMVVPSLSYSTAVDGLASCFGHTLIRHEQVNFTNSRSAKPVVGRALVSPRYVDDDDATPIVVGFKLIREPIYERLCVTLTIDPDEFRVPVLGLETCMAQKIARISLTRARGKRHTRWQDAMDLYDVLHDEQFVESHGVRLAVAIAFEWSRRGGNGTPEILPAPLEWADAWDAACFIDGVRRPPPAEAINSINAAILGL